MHRAVSALGPHADTVMTVSARGNTGERLD